MPKGHPGSDTRITLTCKHCNEPFKVRPYRAKTAFYCSRRCKILYEEAHKGCPVTCKICGKEFLVIPARRTTAKYCSRSCYYKAQFGSIEIECPICRKRFLRSPSHDQQCCSRKCAGKLERMKTAEYASGICKKIEGLELKERCCACGYSKYPQILEVHHIDENRSNNDWNNLTLLCPNCHKIHHFVQPILVIPTILDLMHEVNLNP